eukprot:5592998-Amphidinium_carterae.1
MAEITPPRPVGPPTVPKVTIAEMQTNRHKQVKLIPANLSRTDEEMTTRQLQEAIRNMYFKHHPTIDYNNLTNYDKFATFSSSKASSSSSATSRGVQHFATRPLQTSPTQI